MSVSIVEDIKSVSELKKHAREIFDQLHRTGRPVVITVNGKPDVVLLSARVFEEKLKAFNLAILSESLIGYVSVETASSSRAPKRASEAAISKVRDVAIVKCPVS